MVNVRPFKGVRFPENLLEDKSLIEKLTIKLHLKKTDQVGEILALIKDFSDKNLLLQDAQPALYVIKIFGKGINFLSIVGLVEIDDSVQHHEQVRTDKKNYYQEKTMAFNFQINPVMGLYYASAELDHLLQESLAHTPIISTFINDYLYELWGIYEDEKISTFQHALKSIKTLFIADGHHRVTVAKALATSEPTTVMFAMIDDRHINLKSCHRLLLGKLPPEKELMHKLEKFFFIKRIEHLPETTDQIPFDGFIFIINKHIYEMIVRGEHLDREDLLKRIPHHVLDDILAQIYGEDIYHCMPIGGNINFEKVPKLIEENNAQAAILLPPIKINDFFEVVANKHILPPSSTWFEPKILEGFISYFKASL